MGRGDMLFEIKWRRLFDELHKSEAWQHGTRESEMRTSGPGGRRRHGFTAVAHWELVEGANHAIFLPASWSINALAIRRGGIYVSGHSFDCQRCLITQELSTYFFLESIFID